MKKYWIYALFHKDSNIIEGECTKDGMLVRIDIKNAEPFLRERPKKDNSYWFNDTFDRQIAEVDNWNESKIVGNPQLVWSKGYDIVT